MNKYQNDWVSIWTDVGRSWSKTGRGLAKTALESVAEALKKTAQALETSEERNAAQPGASANTEERPPAQRVEPPTPSGPQPPTAPPNIG